MVGELPEGGGVWAEVGKMASQFMKTQDSPEGLGLDAVGPGSPEEGHKLRVNHTKILGIENITVCIYIRHVPTYYILHKAQKIYSKSSLLLISKRYIMKPISP